MKTVFEKIIFIFLITLGLALIFIEHRDFIFPSGQSCTREDLELAVQTARVPNAEHQILVRTNLGFPIIVDERDGIVARYIMKTGQWEPHVSQVLNKLLKEGDTVVEVGANYGYHTIWMSKLVGKQGRVYTYEANDEVCMLLDKNLAINDLMRNTKVNCIGVSDKIDKARFLTGYSNLGGSFIIGGKANSETIKLAHPGWKEKTVETTFLDNDLNHLKNIKLLRMDAEGSELAILNGARKLIESSKDMNIVMEWDVYMLSHFGDVAALIDFLSTQGFRFYVINAEGGFDFKNKAQMLILPHSDVFITRAPVDQY